MWTAIGITAIVIVSLGLGTALTSACRLEREDQWEWAALSCAAGMGLLAVLLAWLGLAGMLKWARWLMPLGALLTLAMSLPPAQKWRLPPWPRPSLGVTIVAVMAAAAFVGAIAPVTDSDSLVYPLPLAELLAHEGVWRFWPFIATSAYPLSQEMLAAAMLLMRSNRVGLISAVELSVTAILILALAKRLAMDRSSGWLAAVIALGCPTVAFLAPSAKEDLLLLMMTVAGVVALQLTPATGAVIMTGIFAGFAAGAKYTGLPIALALAFLVPFRCGRHQRANSFFITLAAAIASGGIWYLANWIRFGNPFVPLLPSIGHFPVSGTTAEQWLVGSGYGRGVADFFLAPLRMTMEVLLFQSGEFGGRSNWLNPLCWLGLLWTLANPHRWRSFMPLLGVALPLYVAWFFGMQVSRLLLPAAVLLSIPAAEAMLWGIARVRPLAYPVGVAVALSAGIVIVVGGTRISRYVSQPESFLARETEHYKTIQWMNEHLDPGRHRVASLLWPSGYLRIPWMNLGFYQVEINFEDIDNPSRLHAALKRQGFTHVFAPAEQATTLAPWLTPVFHDPDSVVARRFFGAAQTEPVWVYSLE